MTILLIKLIFCSLFPNPPSQGDNRLRHHLPDRRHRQCHRVCRNCASLDNAHRYQLLSLQSGCLRPAVSSHG